MFLPWFLLIGAIVSCVESSSSPTVVPSTIYPTNAPATSGWMTQYRHEEGGCSASRVVSSFSWKTNVCVPDVNGLGNTAPKHGTNEFGSFFNECHNGTFSPVSFVLLLTFWHQGMPFSIITGTLNVLRMAERK